MINANAVLSSLCFVSRMCSHRDARGACHWSCLPSWSGSGMGSLSLPPLTFCITRSFRRESSSWKWSLNLWAYYQREASSRAMTSTFSTFTIVAHWLFLVPWDVGGIQGMILKIRVPSCSRHSVPKCVVHSFKLAELPNIINWEYTRKGGEIQVRLIYQDKPGNCCAPGEIICKLSGLSVCFSFLSSEGVSYMTVCACGLPAAMAFCFLEDLCWEFTACFDSSAVALASRPYPLLEFGRMMECSSCFAWVINVVINK